MGDLKERVEQYLLAGGLFNPELMEPEKVRQLVIDCRTKLKKYRESLAMIRSKIEDAVCTEGCDKGVVMLSQDGPVIYDEDLKIDIYVYEYFSPLGTALIEIHNLTDMD